LEKSGILTLEVIDHNQFLAQTLDNQATRTLINFAGQFYNTNDLGIKIIDGPVVSYASKYPFLITLAISLATGFILVVFSFFLTYWILERNNKKPREKTALKEESKTIFHDWAVPRNKTLPITENSYADFTKKSKAPDNLPVAEDISLWKEIPKEQKAQEARPEKTSITREATPEEVKDRLNKLLSGKM
jgi:hypothetical protein